jgi:hypothetical protein
MASWLVVSPSESTERCPLRPSKSCPDLLAPLTNLACLSTACLHSTHPFVAGFWSPKGWGSFGRRRCHSCQHMTGGLGFGNCAVTENRGWFELSNSTKLIGGRVIAPAGGATAGATGAAQPNAWKGCFPNLTDHVGERAVLVSTPFGHDECSAGTVFWSLERQSELCPVAGDYESPESVGRA